METDFDSTKAQSIDKSLSSMSKRIDLDTRTQHKILIISHTQCCAKQSNTIPTNTHKNMHTYWQ